MHATATCWFSGILRHGWLGFRYLYVALSRPALFRQCLARWVPPYIKALPLAVAVPHISSSYHSLLLTLALAWYALSHAPLCLHAFCFIAGRCLLVLAHLLMRSALGGVASTDYKTMTLEDSLSSP